MRAMPAVAWIARCTWILSAAAWAAACTSLADDPIAMDAATGVDAGDSDRTPWDVDAGGPMTEPRRSTPLADPVTPPLQCSVVSHASWAGCRDGDCPLRNGVRLTCPEAGIRPQVLTADDGTITLVDLVRVGWYVDSARPNHAVRVLEVTRAELRQAEWYTAHDVLLHEDVAHRGWLLLSTPQGIVRAPADHGLHPVGSNEVGMELSFPSVAELLEPLTDHPASQLWDAAFTVAATADDSEDVFADVLHVLYAPMDAGETLRLVEGAPTSGYQHRELCDAACEPSRFTLDAGTLQVVPTVSWDELAPDPQPTNPPEHGCDGVHYTTSTTSDRWAPPPQCPPGSEPAGTRYRLATERGAIAQTSDGHTWYAVIVHGHSSSCQWMPDSYDNPHPGSLRCVQGYRDWDVRESKLQLYRDDDFDAPAYELALSGAPTIRELGMSAQDTMLSLYLVETPQPNRPAQLRYLWIDTTLF